MWRALLADEPSVLRSSLLAALASNVAVTGSNAPDITDLAVNTAAAVADVQTNGGSTAVGAVHAGCLRAVMAADSSGAAQFELEQTQIDRSAVREVQL